MIKNCVVCGKEFDSKTIGKTCSEPCWKINSKFVDKKYYQKHKKECLEYQKEYHTLHREKKLKRMREYHKTHGVKRNRNRIEYNRNYRLTDNGKRIEKLRQIKHQLLKKIVYETLRKSGLSPELLLKEALCNANLTLEDLVQKDNHGAINLPEQSLNAS